MWFGGKQENVKEGGLHEYQLLTLENVIFFKGPMKPAYPEYLDFELSLVMILRIEM